MKIVLYFSRTDGIGEKLFETIEKLVIADEIETFRTIDSLAHRLRKRAYDLKITVLLASTSEELSEILKIKELLQDNRIIIILPDEDKTTLSMAHALYPRFISYIDSNFEDVAIALGKMIDYLAS